MKERRDVCSMLVARYEQDACLREMNRTYVYTSLHHNARALVENGDIIITPRAKKVRSQVSAGRCFVFWDRKGVILEYYLEPRQTVICKMCSDMLRNRVKPVVLRKHHGLLSPGVCLHHVSALQPVIPGNRFRI